MLILKVRPLIVSEMCYLPDGLLLAFCTEECQLATCSPVNRITRVD